MDTLDALVVDNLVERLLHPDRLSATLASLWAGRAQKAAEVDGRVAALQAWCEQPKTSSSGFTA